MQSPPKPKHVIPIEARDGGHSRSGDDAIGTSFPNFPFTIGGATKSFGTGGCRHARKTRRNLFPLTLLLLATGTLAAQDVKYNFMPGTDFSKYHTYKWVGIEGGAHPNQIVDAQIKQSVDSQLAFL
jgi:hypothetical protein